jgi:hypothetical protein
MDQAADQGSRCPDVCHISYRFERPLGEPCCGRWPTPGPWALIKQLGS